MVKTHTKANIYAITLIHIQHEQCTWKHRDKKHVHETTITILIIRQQ